MTTTVDPATARGELDALRDSVRGALTRAWPSALQASSGDLGSAWSVAVAQGWTEFGGDDLLEAALVVAAELGRVACPLPVLDCAVTARMRPGLDAAIADGRSRPVVAVGTVGVPSSGQTARPPTVRHVEGAPVATDLVVLDLAARQVACFSLRHAEIVTLVGLPQPAWSQVRPADGPLWTADLDDEAVLQLRLGLAVRMLAAVRRTHELARDHAVTRRQFGQAVGTFQAVAHRLVDTETELTAADHLLDHALRIRHGDRDHWHLAAEIYLAHAESVAARLQFDAHHTLAAIGYFDEHEGPWLFRRVHADRAHLRQLSDGPSVGEMLLDRQLTLPAFDLGGPAEELRGQVLDAFAPWAGTHPAHLGGWDDEARNVLRDRGWIGVGWPLEAGGLGLGIKERLAFSEALAYADPPLGNIMMGINSVAPVIITAGTDEQKRDLLPQLQRGDVTIALGYSEPEAGSDLVSLRTRAVRVEGGWSISGQKSWGTCLPDSQYVLVAARTDPDSRPSAGISLFLVDADSPGITVQNHVSLAGEVSSTSFWDDVVVPDNRLIGAPNAGWAALSSALAGERVLIGASVARVHASLDRLLRLLPSLPTGSSPAAAARLRAEIGRLAVRLQAARALVVAGVEATATGGGQLLEAPMAKILATELSEDFNATVIGLLGPDALYADGTPGVIGGGYLEQALRTSIMGVVSGGTNDIQRNLIARGLGLPKPPPVAA